MGNNNKVVFIVGQQNFQDEEYFESKKIFLNNGFEVDTASVFIGENRGKLGGVCNVNKLFSEVDATEYDAIIYIGGSGVIALWDDWRAKGLAKIFFEHKKLVAAIGSGTVILANAGILQGIKAASPKNDEGHLRHSGAECSEESIVISENIITASGKDVVKDFASKIIEYIKNN